MEIVNSPDARNIREQKIVDHRMRWLEYPDDLIQIFLMGKTIVGESVCAVESVADLQLEIRGNNRTHHYFEIFLPPLTFFQFCIEEIRVRCICSYNSKILVAIAQCHGSGFLYQPVLRKFFGFAQPDVACGEVDMKHTAQHQLQRAP